MEPSVQREIRPDERVTDAVVAAVAQETGRDPDSLEPFATSIDAAAVDALLADGEGDGPGRLSVVYEGCRVTVEGGVVTVEAGVEA